MLAQIFGFFVTGLFLGIQHSLEPDHVAAVSTLVTRNKSLKRSALMGAIWGLGHTSTILIVGVVVLLFKISIPDFLSQIFEFCVGIVLVYLGAVLLKQVFVDRLHIHKHRHGKTEHIHLHTHKVSHYHDHLHKPFLVGMLHGLAGSGGVMLLIVASMDSVSQGLTLVVMFGIGSILGMAASGALIGLPILITNNKAGISRIFMAAIACISVGLGISVLRNNWLF